MDDFVFQNNIGQIYLWPLNGSGSAINFSTGAGLKPGSGYLYGGGLADWRVVGCTDINAEARRTLSSRTMPARSMCGCWMAPGAR